MKKLNNIGWPKSQDLRLSTGPIIDVASPEDNLSKIDLLVDISTVHEEGVLDIPASPPEVLGVALPRAILNTKLNIHFVSRTNVAENCVQKILNNFKI